jgi:hypothetical protein
MVSYISAAVRGTQQVVHGCGFLDCISASVGFLLADFPTLKIGVTICDEVSNCELHGPIDQNTALFMHIAVRTLLSTTSSVVLVHFHALYFFHSLPRGSVALTTQNPLKKLSP